MESLISRGLISFILVISLNVSAAAQDNSVIEIRTIGIPPYGIQSASESSGIYFDVANLLAEEAGYEANNLIYPYARIINELKTGQTDLTIMFKYPELEEYVNYIAPLPSLKTVVIGLEGSSIDSIESLKGKTLAYLRGAEFSDSIDSDPDIVKQATDDFTQGIRMLRFGRVDAIIGPLAPILSAMEEESDIAFAEPFIVDERTPWVQISKQSESRLSSARLNSIFSIILNRGDLEAIQLRYGATDD